MKNRAVVLLKDGTVFHGSSIGLDGTVSGEICFNTGMSGYQEIFTDPSYKGQIMVTANVHIGNYGIADEDSENLKVQISGLITRNFSEVQSRVKAEGKTLKDFLYNQDIVAITDVDTRALVKHIRDNGAQNALISTEIDGMDSLKEKLKDTEYGKMEFAEKVIRANRGKVDCSAFLPMLNTICDIIDKK